MRRLLAAQTHLMLRLVIFLMIPAGLAALVAVAFVMQPPADWAEWIRPLRQTAFGIGFAFLGAAIVALKVLPPRRELMRSAASADPSGVPAPVSLLLVSLAASSVLQLPVLLAWSQESAALIERLTGGGRDPSGLWIIPATMVSAPPFLAALIIALSVQTSIAVGIARGSVVTRVLWTCVLLQGGLVIGCSLALPPIQDLVARVLAVAASSPDATVAATINAAVEPQNRYASSLLSRFQWILGGYVVVACVRSFWQPRSKSVVDTSASQVAYPDPAVAGLDVMTATPAQAVMPPSEVSSAFDGAEYRVLLQTHWIVAAFRISPLDYTITPVPARANQVRFSFSERDGLLRREPDATPVMAVQSEGSVWSSRTTRVVAAPSGGVIGFLQRDGVDWNVLDSFRRTIAQVQEVETRKGYFRYRLLVGGVEACRFTWAMHGLGVWSAAMDVEFLDSGVRRIDPAYAMALAPILESRARRTSQWMD